MPICMDRVPMGGRGLKILEQSKLRYSNRLLSSSLTAKYIGGGHMIVKETAETSDITSR